MKRTFTIAALICSVTTALMISCTEGPKPINQSEISQDSLVKRGDYLVTAMGCDDCHSPKKFGPTGPQLDMEKRLSGHPSDAQRGKADLSVMKNGWVLFSMDQTAAVGPWGMSFAANLTSHATGIGNWTEEQFFKALRHGKYKGMDEGRPLLPPMPWQAIGKLNDTDIKAIFAYLKTTKPVENLVPSPKPITEL